jgi:hypothetical protein
LGGGRNEEGAEGTLKNEREVVAFMDVNGRRTRWAGNPSQSNARNDIPGNGDAPARAFNSDPNGTGGDGQSNGRAAKIRSLGIKERVLPMQRIQRSKLCCVSRERNDRGVEYRNIN